MARIVSSRRSPDPTFDATPLKRLSADRSNRICAVNTDGPTLERVSILHYYEGGRKYGECRTPCGRFAEDFVLSKTIKYLFLLIPVFHVPTWFPQSSLPPAVNVYINKIAGVFSPQTKQLSDGTSYRR